MPSDPALPLPHKEVRLEGGGADFCDSKTWLRPAKLAVLSSGFKTAVRVHPTKALQLDDQINDQLSRLLLVP